MPIYNNPASLLVAFGLAAGFAFAYPLIKLQRIELTRNRLAALAVALGIALYQRHLAVLVLCVWPLSLIWFSEFWGNYNGWLQQGYLTQKSPPWLVATMGWLLLLSVPLVFHGIDLVSGISL